MPRRDLLLDVSRSLWRAWTGELPTGVDRVCLAYIERYRTRSRAVVQWRGRYRILTPRVSDGLFELLLHRRGRFRRALIRHLLTRVVQLPGGHDGRGRPYLNLGHTGLDHPRFVANIERANVRPIYFLHDLIPISHPQFSRHDGPARHERRVAAMARTGAGIIVNSHATRDALRDWARQREVHLPPVCVAWLGTERLPAPDGRAPLAEPYFVVLGTIEGRKNHRMLFELWRDLAAERRAVPKLVVIGKRGWSAEDAIAMLDDPACMANIIEIARCDDATLATFLGHARALLFPSFVEGFGMPLTEALSLGVPVVASDIAAFREIGGDRPRYIAPGDRRGWRDAVVELADRPARPPAERSRIAAAFTAPDWATHFARVEAYLATL